MEFTPWQYSYKSRDPLIIQFNQPNMSKRRAKLQPIVEKSKPYVKKGAREVLGLAKRVTTMAIAFIIGLQVKTGGNSSVGNQPMQGNNVEHYDAKTKYGYELFEAGKQHAIDSIKIADYEKQIIELKQKAVSDSIKLAKMAKKLK